LLNIFPTSSWLFELRIGSREAVLTQVTGESPACIKPRQPYKSLTLQLLLSPVTLLLYLPTRSDKCCHHRIDNQIGSSLSFPQNAARRGERPVGEIHRRPLVFPCIPFSSSLPMATVRCWHYNIQTYLRPAAHHFDRQLPKHRNEA
jgi:hypothetical protein